MSWNTETNLTPGAPAVSKQTNNSLVGFVEDEWDPGSYPCVRSVFDFGPDAVSVGAEGNIYLRRAGDFSWIRTQVKLRQGGALDFNIAQNFGTTLADPNKVRIPWAQLQSPHAQVYKVIPDGTGGWFVAGDFTHVFDNDFSSEFRRSLFKVNSDGSLDLTFDADLDGPVYTMRLHGGVLYVGGDFETSSGNTHKRIVGLNPTDGSIVMGGFEVDNGIVLAIEIYQHNGTTYMVHGGSYTSVNGTAKNRIAQVIIPSSPGNVTNVASWSVNFNWPVRSIVATDDGLWVGGAFLTPAKGLCKLDFNANVVKSVDLTIGSGDGVVNALYLEPSSKVLYVGGSFDTVSTSAGTFTRNNVAAFRENLAVSDSNFLFGWHPATNGPVLSLNATNDSIFIGGQFTIISGVDRNRVAEAAQSVDASILEWNPNITAAFGTGIASVRSIAYDAVNFRVLLGGTLSFSGSDPRNKIASYQLNAPTATKVILDEQNIALPISKRIAVLKELTCGEKLKVWFMDGDTGELLRYAEGWVEWSDDYSVRVEVGPAGEQGPSIVEATLREGALPCEKAVDGTYEPCDPEVLIQHFDINVLPSHLPEAYPRIIYSGSNDILSYTGPRSWAKGVRGFNPPNQRPARWWHESIDVGEVYNVEEDEFLVDSELGELSLRGDLTSDSNQFSHSWCLGIEDIQGHPSQYINLTNDPVSARWFNILMAGHKEVIGDTIKFEGLSLRLDFKTNAIALGMAQDLGIKKNAAKRAFGSAAPEERDLIHPGKFTPSFINWTTLPNLDQWVNGIWIKIHMDCMNMFTVELWGRNGLGDVAKIGALTVNLDPVFEGGPLNTELLGNTWALMSYMEGVNLSLLNDEDNSRIILNKLTAGLEESCEIIVEED